jgi:hypothetical protein
MAYFPYLHRAGGLSMPLFETDYSKQVFSFASPDNPTLHFDISGLYALIQAKRPPFDKVEVRDCALEINQVVHIVEFNGITKHGLKRCLNFLERPGLIADHGEKQTIIDGNHRFVTRAYLGHKTMQFYWLTREQWKLGLIDIDDTLAGVNWPIKK